MDKRLELSVKTQLRVISETTCCYLEQAVTVNRTFCTDGDVLYLYITV